MCIDPVSAALLATSLASTGMSAYGALQGGKAAKDQARLDAAQNEMQGQLADFAASQSLMYGKINSEMVKNIAGLNDKITSTTADTNIALIGATTDFNVATIKATTDFNVASAEGAGQILEAQGELGALTHKNNADIAELQAQDVQEQGLQAERQSRSRYAQLKGQQRAALAANGVALDEGSALRIQSDTDYASDVDADVIKSNAMKAALGFRVQGANELIASKMASLNGKSGALEKHAEAVAAKINGATQSAQATIDGTVRALDTKMTASFSILNNDINAAVDAMNITNQADQDAWAMKAQAVGYRGQAAQAKLTASSIHPGLMAGTTLLAGASQLAGQWYSMNKAGATGAKKGT